MIECLARSVVVMVGSLNYNIARKRRNISFWLTMICTIKLLKPSRSRGRFWCNLDVDRNMAGGNGKHRD